MALIKKAPRAALDIALLTANRDARASAVRWALLAALVGNDSAPVIRGRVLLATDGGQVDRPEARHSSVKSYHAAVSKPKHWTRFLHTLTRRLAPETVIELGTAVGMSACAIASALSTSGHLWTIEMNAEASNVAGRVFMNVGVADRVTRIVGDFDSELEGALANAAPVGLVFIDGNHQEAATLRYFRQCLPFLDSNAIIVLDDIHWSPGMDRTWRRIRKHDSVAWSVDLGGMGVLAILDG